MLEESDLDLLTQELTPVQHKWENIGNESLPDNLTIAADKIRARSSDDSDCLRTTLKTLFSPLDCPTTTWRNIVDALRSPDVKESELADELEAKYCPSEFINNNILLYFSEYSVVQHCTRSTPHKV